MVEHCFAECDHTVFRSLHVFDELESTNRFAKECAQHGGLEGTVVLARRQTQGRGRFERVWESPEGGVYLSVLLRPQISPEQTTLFPMLSAVAVSKTLKKFGVSSTIKWPNDVLIRGKKVAGILAESEICGAQVSYIVVGIGVNLNTKLRQLSPSLSSTSTSVFLEKQYLTDYCDFLRVLLSQFAAYYLKLVQNKSSEIVGEWKTLSDTLGKNVRLTTSSGDVIGVAEDIDASGFLLVRTSSGAQHRITSGDCVYFE